MFFINRSIQFYYEKILTCHYRFGSIEYQYFPFLKSQYDVSGGSDVQREVL
jgi:hypothetical protein